MTQKYKTLLYAIFFTIWLIRIYYKLYDKRVRKYVLTIGFLIVFWMIIRINKSVIDINILERYSWYLYYISLIFIPCIFYICASSILNNFNKWKKILIYLISTILLILVLTNDLHQLVFKFNNGSFYYDDYSYKFGYYIISVWIFLLFGGGMIKLAINRMKVYKDIKVFMPIIVLLLGITYTACYVLDIKPFSAMNMSIVNSVLICIGIELIFYLDLIPNNSKYIKTFENSNLDIMIISINGKSMYKTKEFNLLPESIYNDINKNMPRDNYIFDNINYKVKRNNDSFVILKSDLSMLNNLKKEIKTNQKKLLEQEKSLILEKKTKEELYKIQLRKNAIEKVESKLKENKEKINCILNKNNVTNDDLIMLKKLIIYSKKKSMLVISELNDDIYNEDNVKIVLSELIKSISDINFVIIAKNKFNINAYYLSIMYDILFELLSVLKSKNIVIYITYDKDILLKLQIEGRENIKNKLSLDKNILIKENIYDNDTELLFTIKGSDTF